MSYQFENYEIHIVISSNYPDKFVAYIEELHNVSEIIDSKELAEGFLRPKFEKEIKRLKDIGKTIPKPGSGKAEITFAASDKLDDLHPFIDEFWTKILGTSYATSFVSNESDFSSWEHYLEGGKQELIEKVKKYYHYDISGIYERPIHEILRELRNKESFLTKIKRWLNLFSVILIVYFTIASCANPFGKGT